MNTIQVKVWGMIGSLYTAGLLKSIYNDMGQPTKKGQLFNLQSKTQFSSKKKNEKKE